MPVNGNGKTSTTPATTTDDGWEDVTQETQVVFHTIGDEFIGEFIGWSETPGKGIAQAHFQNADSKFFVNCGWSLKQQLKEIKKGTLCKLRYEADQDTGQETPMMLFKVQTKRATK
jgi:galactose mutarotase-like enzyme